MTTTKVPILPFKNQEEVEELRELLSYAADQAAQAGENEHASVYRELLSRLDPVPVIRAYGHQL